MNQDKDIQLIVDKVLAIYNNKAHETVAKPAFTAPLETLIENVALSSQKMLTIPLKMRTHIVTQVSAQIQKIVPELIKAGIADWQWGKLEDKLQALDLILQNSAGVADLHPSVITGDDGLTLTEYSPYGVIVSILPLQNLFETLVSNLINMVAAGNGVVFVVPDCALAVCQVLINELNYIILYVNGPKELLGVVAESSLNDAVKHPKVNVVVVTQQDHNGLTIPLSKKVIITGIPHTPVIVDETANIEKAAKDIVAGASFDHGQLFMAEKVLICVDRVADFLQHHLLTNGTYFLTKDEQAQFEGLVNENLAPLQGLSAEAILAKLGKTDKVQGVQLIAFETPHNHPLLNCPMNFPVLPFVRVKDINEAIALAQKVEGDIKHTAVLHSKHVDNLTLCARLLQTIVFIKNAPSYAGIGLNGEGSTSYTIAAVTGEGTMGSRQYSRRRRCILADGFYIK